MAHHTLTNVAALQKSIDIFFPEMVQDSFSPRAFEVAKSYNFSPHTQSMGELESNYIIELKEQLKRCNLLGCTFAS